jgi:hypothetical protein
VGCIGGRERAGAQARVRAGERTSVGEQLTRSGFPLHIYHIISDISWLSKGLGAESVEYVYAERKGYQLGGILYCYKITYIAIYITSCSLHAPSEPVSLK